MIRPLTAEGEDAAARIGRRVTAALGRARTFWRDRRGVAALEFALIVPLLIGMYFMTQEVSQAIETNKKLSRAAALVGDAISQQSDVTAADVDAIMQIAVALLQPYNRTKPTVTVTGVKVTTDATPKAQVLWSRRISNGATGAGLGKGSNVTIPDKLRTPGKFLVMVETRLSYKPFIVFAASDKQALGVASAFAELKMGDNSFQVPRTIDQIDCTGC